MIDAAATEGDIVGVSDPTRCDKCGYNKFTVFHREAKKAMRFLWWHWPAQEEYLELWCLACSAKLKRKIGEVTHKVSTLG